MIQNSSASPDTWSQSDSSCKMATTPGRWARENGLDQLLSDGSLTAKPVAGTDFFLLDWIGSDRGGNRRPYSARVNFRSGLFSVARAFDNWSRSCTIDSHVVIAPDMITYWRLVGAIGDRSVFPYLIVAPVSPTNLPIEWSNAQYWGFKQLTVLSPASAQGSQILTALTSAHPPGARVATPPLGFYTWCSWLSNHVVDYDVLDGVHNRAMPIEDYQPVRFDPRAGMPLHQMRSPDARGRFARPVTRGKTVANGGTSSHFLVRSDRTWAPLVPTKRPRTFAAEGNGPSSGGWSVGSAEAFIGGGAAACDIAIPLASRLEQCLTNTLGDGAHGVRALVAYIALTYVYSAFDELPVLLVRGGSSSARLALRRLMTAVCHAPVTATRTRAANLARLVDANDGVLLLDEPGPLIGPTGSTEIGRFLEAGSIREASVYNTLSGHSGLRSLELFGPKTLFANAIATGGLNCSVVLVDLPSGQGQTTGKLDPDYLLGMRDDFYTWSMAAVMDLLQSDLSKAPAHQIIPGLISLLFESVASGTGFEGREDRGDVSEPALISESVASPGQCLDAALSACAAREYLSMVQLQLEVALSAGDPEALSPERVGRWIVLQPQIDAARPATRRRLFGQISRIYPLMTDRPRPGADATEAFDFCVQTKCGDCRYEPVCEATFPGMRGRKNAALAGGAEAAQVSHAPS